MSYDFYIPCEPDNWTVATITEDRELILNDYNADADLAAEELGFGESLCLKVFRSWELDPVQLICGGMLIPINDTGVAACAWARYAIIETASGFKPGDLCIVKESIGLAEKNFLGKRIPYRRILDAKRHLSRITAESAGYSYGEIIVSPSGRAARAVLSCLISITNVAEQIATFGGIVNQISDFCNVAIEVGHIIQQKDNNRIGLDYSSQQTVFNSEILLDVAIETLTNLQRARGGLR